MMLFASGTTVYGCRATLELGLLSTFSCMLWLYYRAYKPWLRDRGVEPGEGAVLWIIKELCFIHCYVTGHPKLSVSKQPFIIMAHISGG